MAGRNRRRPEWAQLANGYEMKVIEGPRLGPGMTTASHAEVLEALETFDLEAGWAAIRDQVRPLLPRERPAPSDVDDIVTVVLPPGIGVGFGLDLGPAVAFIGEMQLREWGVDRLNVAETALANVRRIFADLDERAVIRASLLDVPVLAFQSGFGVASALLLVPDFLPAFFGQGPHLLLAPMRDLLVALPEDVDANLAQWLSGELEALDPNHLHIGSFHHESGAIATRSVASRRSDIH